MSDQLGKELVHDVPSENLRPEDVPGADAEWHPTIAAFALTFDGYAAMGNRIFSYAERRLDRWREDGSLARGLDHLRACLFMEQRAVRWAENWPSGGGPTDEQLAYARDLMGAIRRAAEKRVRAEERASMGQRRSQGIDVETR